MTSLKISDLTPHPKNEYFFDDITGERWTEFVNSIKEGGVRTPIIVTDNMVIVSGNQRVRACKELGISVIDAEVRHYASEDEVIKDLIETNLRQRGVICDSEVKAGRRFAELKRIEGFKEGRRKLDQVGLVKSQETLAAEFGISKTEMNRLIAISKAEPAVQDLLESGKISKSSALTMISKLSAEDQKDVAKEISGRDSRVTESELRRIIEERDRRIRDLESREPETKVVEKVVVPEDYEQAKKMYQVRDKDFRSMQKLYDEMAEKWKKAETEKEALIAKMNEPEEKRRERRETDAFALCAAMSNFLERIGGYIYLVHELNELPKRERDGITRGITAVYNWANEMLNSQVEEVME